MRDPTAVGTAIVIAVPTAVGSRTDAPARGALGPTAVVSVTPLVKAGGD